MHFCQNSYNLADFVSKKCAIFVRLTLSIWTFFSFYTIYGEWSESMLLFSFIKILGKKCKKRVHTFLSNMEKNSPYLTKMSTVPFSYRFCPKFLWKWKVTYLHFILHEKKKVPYAQSEPHKNWTCQSYKIGQNRRILANFTNCCLKKWQSTFWPSH